jgi:membrane associated rhomboid family serine protease
MFIPINADTQGDSRVSVPWVTWALVALNMVGFCLQVVLRDRVTYGYSLVPAEFVQGRDVVGRHSVAVTVRTRGGVRQQSVSILHQAGPRPIQLTLLTSMFLHVGLGHLLGNLIFLVVFGPHVERALSGPVYLAGYLLCGMAGGMAHIATDPRSLMPCLGASGAIAGILGAYLLLHPLSRITLWLLIGTFRVPAFVLLLGWLALQFNGMAARARGEAVGVAYAAHLGGFAAGLLLLIGLAVYQKIEGRSQEGRENALEPGDPLGSFLPRTSSGVRRVEEQWR